ncbi:DAK2 domain-containing protein [Natronoglycomyces albus]|nr:DAK2 domain-containing protein [Natronoglycomyces albus]
MKPETLDSQLLRTWGASALETLLRHRRAVDQLNVFPVADSDTGTNMVATLQAACRDLQPSDSSVGALVAAAAQRALVAARGNSGVILAQMLRGLADSWTGRVVDGPRFAAGLDTAATSAAGAVAVPTHGTMLTVAAAAAAAAHRHASAGLVSAAEAAAEAAAAAVGATPSQLPALARAGVVDSGGMGLALLMDTFVETLTGSNPGRAQRLLRAQRPGAGQRPFVPQVPRESGSVDYAYEVQYLLEATADGVEQLRERLAGLGDSLVIIGSAATSDSEEPPTWNVHVHVNNIGAAIEAGIEVGRVHRLSVTRFEDVAHKSTDSCGAAHATTHRTIVAITAHTAMAPLLSKEGCHVARDSSPEAIGQAIRASGGGDVIILVDGPHAKPGAESAAALARADGWRVWVIPTSGLPQILAAVAVHDPARRFDDDVIAMAEAAAACHVGEVRIVTAEADTAAGRAPVGSILLLVDADVLAIGHDLLSSSADLLSRLCSAGAELITLIPGAAMSAQDVTSLVEDIGHRWPLVEIQRFPGGQAEPALLIGAE